jgi:hypothetical protein
VTKEDYADIKAERKFRSDFATWLLEHLIRADCPLTSDRLGNLRYVSFSLRPEIREDLAKSIDKISTVYEEPRQPDVKEALLVATIIHALDQLLDSVGKPWARKKS